MMDPTPEVETQRFDFATNAWVRDDFLTRRTVELPAPATPPREGFWTAPAAKTRRPLSNVALGIVMAVVVAMSVCVGANGVDGLIPAGIVALFGLLLVHNLPAPAPHADEGDLRLMEVADDPDVCLVDVEVVFDGRKVGTDRGVAWFDDGALLFSGRRTSFAIGGEDVLPRSYWGEYGRERASALPPDAVPLRARSPRTYVRLVPVPHDADAAAHQNQRFSKRREGFRDRPERSSVSRQWPPFAL